MQAFTIFSFLTSYQILCMLQRWCILIPEDFVGDQAIHKEATVLLRRLGTLSSCTELNHVTKRIQALVCQPQPNRTASRRTRTRVHPTHASLRASSRSLQSHSASSLQTHLRLQSLDRDLAALPSGSPGHQSASSVSTLSTGGGGRHQSLTSKASSTASLNTVSSITTLPVVDSSITNMPLEQLDSLYCQVSDDTFVTQYKKRYILSTFEKPQNI